MQVCGETEKNVIYINSTSLNMFALEILGMGKSTSSALANSYGAVYQLRDRCTLRCLHFRRSELSLKCFSSIFLEM